MGSSKKDDIPGWIIFITMFPPFFPLGLVLMFLNWLGIPAELKKSFRQGAQQSRQTRYDQAQARARYQQQAQTPPFAQDAPIYTGQARPGSQQTQQQAQTWAQSQMGSQTPPKTVKNAKVKNRFKSKTKTNTLGSVFIGIGAFTSFAFLMGFVEEFSYALRYGLLSHTGNWFPLFGFFCAGLFTLGTGINMTRKQRRLRLYLGVIGTRQSVFIADLASAAGVNEKKVISDLQDFLSDGTFPAGYIDRASGRLVFTDQGYDPAYTPEPKAQEVKKEEPKKAETVQEDNDDDILREIKVVNDAIADPEMSRKIDRIGEITGKILDYQRRNPAKTELRQFLNYYLPTTLKILQAYAQLEAQGVEGENISAAKERIEGMMDKVVEGFEKQLDQLFKADAMDIATDVEVLERMLDKDGLGSGMTMGG